MSASSHCFGIDIGTRTTVIYCYNARQKSDYVVKLRGDEVVPTAYLEMPDGRCFIGSEALRRVVEEPQFSDKLASNFKIRWWARHDQKAPPDADVQLLQWLSLLKRELSAEFGEDFRRAWFCFTYPAQRDQFQSEFEALVTRAGFPRDRVRFIDECSAAAYGVGWERDLQAEEGEDATQARLAAVFGFGKRNVTNGLLIDIGAGTTDIVVGALDLNSARIKCLSTRSTNVAGSACTRELSTLAKPIRANVNDASANWVDYSEKRPFEADRQKERISDEYRSGDNRDAPHQIGIGRWGIHLEVPSFDAFRKTAIPVWEKIRSSASQAWNNAGIGYSEPDWVMLVGGGARHTGLVSLMQQHYSSLIREATDSRVVTARGAMYHIAWTALPNFTPQRGVKQGKVVQVLANSVDVEFPSDTQVGTIRLFDANSELNLSEQRVERAVRVTLKSNFFAAEGDAFVVVGGTRKKLGKVDVNWEVFGERNNHAAIVHAMLDPGSRVLRVILNLQNVKLHETVAGEVEVTLAVPGGFDHV